MRERRPDRLAKTEAKAKLAGGTPPADAPHRKDTRFIAGGPLTQRANGREKDKETAPEQKAAKRIKQEPKHCKPAAPAANRAPARAAAHRLPAAAHQQPVKVEKQPMPVAEPAEDAGEVAEEDEENLHPVPQKVTVGGSPVYVVDKRLGKGGFGQVYLGKRLPRRNVPASRASPTIPKWRQLQSAVQLKVQAHMSKLPFKGRSAFGKPNRNEDAMYSQVAIKFEHKTSKGCVAGGPPYEWSVYASLGDVYGVPKLLYKGQCGDFFVMIMDLLGPSLWDIWSLEGQRIQPKHAACMAVEALSILQKIHAKGWVHGDVKPENFLMGPADSDKASRLWLVDLGLATKWRDRTMQHVKYEQRPDDFRGTVRYASVHAHLGRVASRRDDLESLAYTLIFLLEGRLPWQGYQGENKGLFVCKKKMGTSTEDLCTRLNKAFKEFAEAAMSLRFEDEPRYEAYQALFEPLLYNATSSEKPITIDPTLRVGMKRGRAELDWDEEGDGTARKRLRQGMRSQQWITVYNKHVVMKQRYHYNVATARLDVHVRKGLTDGLQISSVACTGDLWALIMDAGSGLGSQVYKLASGQFLPKEWIMEQWDRGFYISSVAGSQFGDSLTVMSKGTRFTQQSYKVSDIFPFEWIKKKWREGFHISAMATGGHPGRVPASYSQSAVCPWQWAIVMSRTTGYADQVVELDFAYPSEGIHKRWDIGYRITAAAATPDQAAFALSLPRRPAAMDEAQETLRTSTFPSSHVKEKWDKNLYISAVAFGRTVP